MRQHPKRVHYTHQITKKKPLSLHGRKVKQCAKEGKEWGKKKKHSTGMLAHNDGRLIFYDFTSHKSQTWP